MNNHSLLLLIVTVCFSFVALVGRIAEQRLLKRGLTDWDRLWLLLFTAMSFTVVERAGKAGWLPDSPLFATLITIGTGIVILPAVYLVVKIFLEVKRNEVRRTPSSPPSEAITKP